MKFVIHGAGVVGSQIARELIAEGKDVVLIDKDPERAKHASQHLDSYVIAGDGTSVAILKEAGIESADCFISVTNVDEVNLISCGIVASEFNVSVNIARVRNLEYSRSKVFSGTLFGINFIVNSEVETARQIANTVALGATSDVMLFENSEFQMRNAVVDPASYFVNRSIKNITRTIKEDFLIAAIIRDQNFIIPSGDTVVREKDNLYFFATRESLTKIFMESGKKSDKIDKIFIAGGGTIGSLVCQYLIRTGRKITVIEKNYDICKKLSARFPDALILNADITDEDLYGEELLNTYDLIIATTDNDELNILTCLYAKKLGTRRAVALVARTNYVDIASQLNIDVIINPKDSTVDAILKFVRMGDIKSVHSIFYGKVEVIESSVNRESILNGSLIKDIDMPPNSLILSVRRDAVDHIPHGNFEILEGDTIIIIIHRNEVSKLEKLFTRRAEIQ